MSTFVSGKYTTHNLAKNIFEIEDMITAKALEGTALAITDLGLQKDLRKRIEDASMGRNTVLFTDQHRPSIMVKFEPDQWGQYVDLYGSGDGIHPAFLVDGVVRPFWAPKYSAVRVGGTNYAVSLRGLDPAHSINFDSSLAACVANGAGWHLMTNAQWAFIALMSMARGFQARGNTNYGRHHSETDEWGIGSNNVSNNRYGRTLTGSGPLSWFHDGTPFGVSDMVGNVRPWVGGLRIGGAKDGEINILPNAAGSQRTAGAHHPTTGDWQAILEDGSLATPGADDTLCYIWDGSILRVANAPLGLSETTRTRAFASIDEVPATDIPQILEDLLLFPVSGQAPDGTVYVKADERLALRGGRWLNGSEAGLGYLGLSNTRGITHTRLGFAPAWIG